MQQTPEQLELFNEIREIQYEISVQKQLQLDMIKTLHEAAESILELQGYVEETVEMLYHRNRDLFDKDK